MIDKIKINSRESGMALVFAIGLLALLLAIGIAFVGNAVNARRAAENNSARTQARMFAMSALSRAAASLMINAHQFGRTHDDELPDNFNHLYSFDKSFTFTDWLFDKDDSESLMRMDNILSKSEAMLFNDPFKKNGDWKGNWVFFRDGSHTGSRILGRAAWQVIGSSAQILAPVFFRGHLKTIDPVDDNLSANDRRWGREIDEVNLIDDSDNTAVFYPVNENMQFDSDENAPKILDYGTIYSMITGSGDSAVQRWAKKWFYFDHNGDASAECPSMVKAESYGHNGRSYMRFNISELWQDKYFENPSDDSAKYNSWDKAYDVSSNSSDPWYARLGIDTEGTSKADANSDTAITRLTTDALLHDGVFDYEIVRNASTDGYSGLPFLRRIGNSQGTFDDLATLRKQIAANFNDYCDADDVPTSDVSAEKWLNTIDDGYKHPSYTGNEKTPYLYELGMILSMVNSADKNGIDVTIDSSTKIPSFSTSFWALPVIKLCNMYPLTVSDKEYKADIDFGEVQTEFKITNVKFPKVKFKYQLAENSTSEFEADVVIDLSSFTDSADSKIKHLFDNMLVAKIAENGWGNNDAVSEFGTMDNTPYPVAYPVNKWKKPFSASVMSVVKKDGTAFGAILLGNDILKIAGVSLKVPGSDTAYSFPQNFVSEGTGATPVTGVSFDKMDIRSIEISKITVAPRRAVLSKKVNSTDTGMDYVKFEKVVSGVTENKSFEWNDFDPSTAGIQPLALTFADTLDGVILGGIRTEDPRQNLNSSDWDLDDEARAVFVSDLANSTKTDYNTDIVKVMDIDSTGSGKVNTFVKTSRTASPENPLDLDDPTTENTKMDWETVTEPAYKGASNHISTAVIRNAPMMSPWEIGFIHRGVKWQTLNIKNSMMPTNGFADNGSNWDREGTTYTGGDGAIFEQIKMVDQSNTYGKINVNLLHPKHLDFRIKEDKAMVQALFQGIRYGENPLDFIKNSTRDSNGEFPTQSGGTLINKTAAIAIADDFILDDARSRNFSRRSDFLNHTGTQTHWCLESGYSATIAAQQKTDAAQEEIIGKTINLLSAEKSSPNVVEVTVVAQSIKDMEGTVVRQVNANASDEYRTTSSGNYSSGSVDADGIATKTNCTIGDFDMYEHKKNDDKNVYFDEITGEVKMRATFIFDQLKRRLRIGEVDYL